MHTLTIGDTTIHRDINLRFCINDLHKASGGENRHRPSLWLKLKGTQEFIEELISERETDNLATGIPVAAHDSQSRNSCFGVVPVEDSMKPDMASWNAPIETIKGGEWSGTFAVRELAYDYAMWVSKKFEIQVIRAYDAMVTGEFNQRLLEAEAEKNRAQQKIIQHENYCFTRYPRWQPIRTLTLEGKTYGEVAALIGCSKDSVRRAVKSMIRCSLIDPSELAQVQKGIARLNNLKRGQFWGQQLPLLYGHPQEPLQ